MPLNNPSAEVELKTGEYDGDDSVNRAIPHGLSKTPNLVIIVSGQGSFFLIWKTGGIYSQYGTGQGALSLTAADSTNFHVGNASSYSHSANADTLGYRWVAIA